MCIYCHIRSYTPEIGFQAKGPAKYAPYGRSLRKLKSNGKFPRHLGLETLPETPKIKIFSVEVPAELMTISRSMPFAKAPIYRCRLWQPFSALLCRKVKPKCLILEREVQERTDLIQARRRENEKRKDTLRKASSIPHQEAEGCVDGNRAGNRAGKHGGNHDGNRGGNRAATIAAAIAAAIAATATVAA
jgi:hypothetical protein